MDLKYVLVKNGSRRLFSRKSSAYTLFLVSSQDESRLISTCEESLAPLQIMSSSLISQGPDQDLTEGEAQEIRRLLAGVRTLVLSPEALRFPNVVALVC